MADERERKVMQLALDTLIQWYVQDQGEVIGDEQAREACLRECEAARHLNDLLSGAADGRDKAISWVKTILRKRREGQSIDSALYSLESHLIDAGLLTMEEQANLAGAATVDGREGRIVDDAIRANVEAARAVVELIGKVPPFGTHFGRHIGDCWEELREKARLIAITIEGNEAAGAAPGEAGEGE